MIKLIGCLDKRLQGQKFDSFSYASEVAHSYVPKICCPFCGARPMHGTLKSRQKQHKSPYAGLWLTEPVFFPQYAFTCKTCNRHFYMLLTTDLEIDRSPFTMDQIFSMMYLKKVLKRKNAEIMKAYGMSRTTYMKWYQRFRQDYPLLRCYLPTDSSDEEILTGVITLSPAFVEFFKTQGRFFMHEAANLCVLILPNFQCIQNSTDQ